MKETSVSGDKRGAIDPHTHAYPHAFIEDLRRGRFGKAAVIEKDKGNDFIVIPAKISGKETAIRHKFVPAYYDLDRRFKDMERMGVERHFLSVRPELMFYGIEAALNKELAVSMNDGLSAMAKQYPEKFSAVATVPLQDVAAAVVELERAKKTGHIGVMVNTNVSGMNLHDPSLDPFWAKAAAIGMPVFLHPSGVCGEKDRLKEFHLRNFIGNPLDTSIAVACLIFGGVLDRFPKLRFYLSHMGGYVPWIRGRWQHGYSVREEPKIHGARDPEQYIGRFYYDTIIHNADCFEFAVKTLGVDRIVYGTDYPADMANHQPAREIPGLSRLSEADQAQILYGNAKKIYGL